MFYGESWPVWDLVTLRGPVSIDFDALTFHWDGTANDLGGGSAFLVSVQAAPNDLVALQDAAADVVVSWVLEVGGNSDGSVALASGLMPSSETLAEDWVTEPLGTYPAVGARTIVSAPTSIAVTDLLSHAQLAVLRVECTGAPLELLQVKLRVWPSGGALGAWVDGRGFEMHGAARIMVSEPLGFESEQVAGYEDAWTLAKHAVSTWHGSMVNWLQTEDPGYVEQELRVMHAINVPPFLPFGTVGMRMTILSGVPPVANQAGPEDTDAGFDPNEIVQELTAQIRTGVGVPVQTVFAGWPMFESGVQLDDRECQVAMRRRREPNFTPSREHDGWVLETFEIPPLNGAVMRNGLVPLLNEQHQTIAAFCPLYYQTDPPTEETLSGIQLSVIAPYCLAVAPAYSYYSPTALPSQPTRRPRFYVTYTEVDDHPRDVSHVVGIGKPADDASLFRVPTPLGTLRELRHGEAVSDVSVAYPLKVKLEDGSWTVVAGMTPDD